MKTKIYRKYMMATTAIHMLGDISSDEPDLCIVHEEDDENYYGNWVSGIGFINVRFPKITTKELTEEDKKKHSGVYSMNGVPLYELDLKNE